MNRLIAESIDLGPFPLIEGLPEYVLKRVVDAKAKARRANIDVVDVGMGNPDGATPKVVVDKIVEAARNKRNHRYGVSRGLLRLREDIVVKYQRDYGAEFDVDTETVVTVGAKDAINNTLRGVLSPGNLVASQNPAYPIHHQAVVFAGGVPVMLDTSDPSEFLNQLEDLCNTRKIRLILISFPHNPTTVCVDLAFFEEVVRIARKHGIMVVHDFAYADFGLDGYRPPSIMQVPGAKDVAVEIFSFSKSYNMAGWRIGFAVGNKRMMDALMKIKSYLDYGVPQAIQIGGIIALRECQDFPKKICGVYQSRRDVLIDSLKRAGWEIEKPKGTMFVWGQIPKQYLKLGSVGFGEFLLDKALVAVAAGTGFGAGEYADRHVRFALIENERRLRQGGRNIGRAFRGLPPLGTQKHFRSRNDDELVVVA